MGRKGRYHKTGETHTSHNEVQRDSEQQLPRHLIPQHNNSNNNNNNNNNNDDDDDNNNNNNNNVTLL